MSATPRLSDPYRHVNFSDDFLGLPEQNQFKSSPAKWAVSTWKFSNMYIMFPIAIMYYYGTNLDNRFSVPGFWPKPEESYRIPFEREEIKAELERLKRKRLELREKRLQSEAAKKEDDS